MKLSIVFKRPIWQQKWKSVTCRGGNTLYFIILGFWWIFAKFPKSYLEIHWKFTAYESIGGIATSLSLKL